MTITAVVCGGWSERAANVYRIVHDLQHGTVAPDRIFVLDNTEEDPSPFARLADDNVKVLRGFNTECHGKFVAALYAPADYYLLADDDTSVGPRSIEVLMRNAHPGFVTGYWGVLLQEGSFRHGTLVFPGQVVETIRVDAFHGRVLFMAHDALIRMFEAEGKIRTDGDMVGDDILAGLANPKGSVIVPMIGKSGFIDLSEEGVAMNSGEEYFEERDAFTRRALEILR